MYPASIRCINFDVCRYDTRKFGSRAQNGVIDSHPVMAINKEAAKNPYFVTSLSSLFSLLSSLFSLLSSLSLSLSLSLCVCINCISKKIPFKEYYEPAIKAGGDYQDENPYDSKLLEFRLKNLVTWRQEQIISIWQRRQRTDVMGILSHELRTPLNGVIASADLLDHTRENLTPDQEQVCFSPSRPPHQHHSHSHS